MAKKMKPTYKMPFRRRREGRTDYKHRLALLRSGKPRLVVRKSLNYITAQLIQYEEIGDKTVANASSKHLRSLGWKFACDNTPAAYLTGLLIAKRATEKKIKEAVLDAGLYPSTKGSRIYAVVKGAIAGGLHIVVDEKILPSGERISGKHIASGQKDEKFKEMPKQFENIRKKILGKESIKGEKSG